MPIKVIYCLTRKPSLSRDEFQDYWRNIHAPKVMEVAGRIGMIRYVQSHTYDSDMSRAVVASRRGGEPYDGVMEGWMESEESAMALMGTDEGMAAARMLLDDEEKFIDFSRSRIFLTREHIVIP